MSASRPNGRTNAAVASTNAVGIQPRITILTDNDDCIMGRARFKEEPINGMRKAAMETSKRMILCNDLSIITKLIPLLSKNYIIVEYIKFINI
jgi:hypothetical protein